LSRRLRRRKESFMTLPTAEGSAPGEREGRAEGGVQQAQVERRNDGHLDQEVGGAGAGASAIKL